MSGFYALGDIFIHVSLCIITHINNWITMYFTRSEDFLFY
jgi:hypothetical protein